MSEAMVQLRFFTCSVFHWFPSGARRHTPATVLSARSNLKCRWPRTSRPSSSCSRHFQSQASTRKDQSTWQQRNDQLSEADLWQTTAGRLPLVPRTVQPSHFGLGLGVATSEPPSLSFTGVDRCLRFLSWPFYGVPLHEGASRTVRPTGAWHKGADPLKTEHFQAVRPSTTTKLSACSFSQWCLVLCLDARNHIMDMPTVQHIHCFVGCSESCSCCSSIRSWQHGQWRPSVTPSIPSSLCTSWICNFISLLRGG